MERKNLGPIGYLILALHILIPALAGWIGHAYFAADQATIALAIAATAFIVAVATPHGMYSPFSQGALMFASLAGAACVMLAVRDGLLPFEQVRRVKAYVEAWDHWIGVPIATVIAGLLAWVSLFSMLYFYRALAFRAWSVLTGRGKRGVAESERQRWQLAVSAIYVEMHRESLDSGSANFDRLDMGFTSLGHRMSWAACLRRDWEVTDGASLSSTLDWLIEAGHRKELEARIEYETGIAHEAEFRDDEPFEAVALFRRAHPEHGILAWDMIRFVHVVRMGYIAGYIDEATAWRQLERMEALIRGRFNSWAEFLDSWLVGYQYWAGDDVPASEYKDLCLRLLQHPNSPYRRIPFKNSSSEIRSRSAIAPSSLNRDAGRW